MNVFMDAEFNVPTDSLISIGIISEDGLQSFYEVVEYPTEGIAPWVAENVIPILEKEPLPFNTFQETFTKWLKQFPAVNVIVNHPNDVIYFLKALMYGDKGKWVVIPNLTFEVDDNLSGKGSKLLHNAYADAVATRLDWIKKNGYE